MNVYIQINIFSEICNSPNIVAEHPCSTGMNTMSTYCFWLFWNLVIIFLFGTFSSRNTKVESSFEPRKLHSECIRRVIIKCLYMKYQPMTGFLPTQWYIIFINYSNSSGNESDRDNLEIPAATNSSFSGFTGYSPRPKRKIS